MTIKASEATSLMESKMNSVTKAKLYKTARLIDEAWEIPSGFSAGEFVAVSFLRRAWGTNVFQCTSQIGAVAAISDLQLEQFCL